MTSTLTAICQAFFFFFFFCCCCCSPLARLRQAPGAQAPHVGHPKALRTSPSRPAQAEQQPANGVWHGSFG